MTLIPTEKSGISRKIKDSTILIYGNPKIGKSSFAANFPNVFFIDLNSGLGGLDVYKTTKVITSWEDFLGVIAELKLPKNTEKFDWIVIDTIEEAYDLCLTYVCKKKNVEHPSDINDGKGDFGKTWKEITKELSRPIKELKVSNYGRILLSHVREKDNPKDTKIYYRPNLGGGVCTAITSMSNLILYFRIELIPMKNGDRKYVRVIRTLSSKDFLAGCHEVKKKTLPGTLPLDYDTFMKAFKNLITGTTLDSGSEDLRI